MRAGAALLFALAVGGCQAGAGADDAGGAASAGGAGAHGQVSAAFVLPPIPETGYSQNPGDVGGYLLGGLLPPQLKGTLPGTSANACNRLRGVVRDFRGALPAPGGSLQPGGHPDFEVFEGRGLTKGLVAPQLGADGKPVYASRCELGVPVSATCPYGAMTTSAESFKQWYSSLEGVNMTYLVYFSLSDQMLGVSTFSSNDFFPVDNAGFGWSGLDHDGKTRRNYSFTTEIHATFLYNGGETFTFSGDDDVWIFINGKLAVDLGGLHYNTPGSVDLDAQAATLGIEKGAVYPLDLFHAERHSQDSDFRIDMNFAFQDCGYIIP